MTASTSAKGGGGGGKGIGIVLALIVFVVLLFVVIGRNDSNTKVGVKELKVEKVNKDAVEKIDVTLPPKKAAANAGAGADAGPAEASPARRVVLEKQNGAWVVYDGATPDKKFAADEAQVKTALDAIGEFATGELIANKKEKHAELEIDDDKGQLVAVTAKGKTALDLIFGRAAKGGGSTVRMKGSDDVFVAKGRLGSVVRKEVGAWRKKALFELKADEITRVAIANTDGSKLVFESSTPPAPPAPPDGGTAASPRPEWKLVEPATLPAGFRLDKAQLSRPATSFATLRAQDFADGASDATAGFDQPHTIVEANTPAKKTVVHLGKEDDKKRVFAKVDGDPQIYLLAAYSAKQLQKSIDDLRELTLFDAKVDDVERVTFKGSAGTVVVQKKNDAWELVEPKAPPPEFEATQIGSQVAALLRLRGTRVAGDAPATALAKPGPVVELQLKGGKKQTLRFGSGVPLDASEAADAKDAKAKEPKEFYAKGAVDDLTYVIAAFTRNRYEKPAELFKKPPAPPPGIGGGGIPGMEKLPPDVRKKLEESMKKGELPSGHP
jgi:hypothetical protein